ncbi:G8 domain-containing protein [Flagellimonas sp. DF-77]|uniref:G8 domain-containing protein n=1 Tax=Flagellimonas algarum TaxID=3230298 RepID=UPI00339841AC
MGINLPNGRYAALLLCCALLLPMFQLAAQAQKTMLIDKGEVLVWQDSLLEVEHLIIKGVFQFDDTQHTELRFRKLTIDGGSLIAGREQHPLKHELAFVFMGEQGRLEVINNGSLELFGSVSPHAEQQLSFSVGSGASGHIAIEKAGHIHLGGVAFSGLGTSEAYALTFGDVINPNSFLQGCYFEHSKNGDLKLFGGNLSVRRNQFASTQGPSIWSHGAPKAIPVFEENLIHNSSGPDSYAVVLQDHPQWFSSNRIVVENQTHGVKMYAGRSPLEHGVACSNWRFANNEIRNGSKGEQSGNVGLTITDLPCQGIFRSSGNQIDNFGIGAVFLSASILAEDYRFTDNRIGCIPGASYLNQSAFHWSKTRPNAATKALWVTDSLGVPAPKLTKIQIHNYGVGVQFEGKISERNYVEQLQFHNTRPLVITNMNAGSLIHDRDGSFLDGTVIPKTKHEGHYTMPAAHHHHGHAKRKGREGYLWYPVGSFYENEQSRQVEAVSGILLSPERTLGTLTIATGLGLTDPVHEHPGRFESVTMTNTLGASMSFQGRANRYQLELLGETDYGLTFGTEVPGFYDYGFEWEAPTGQSIYLKLPYPHPDPVAMRSFGNAIAAVDGRQALKESTESSFYWDKKNKMVHLKMVAQDHFEEMVIYSNRVRTEIDIEGQKVPLTIAMDPTGEQLIFEFRSPKEGSFSKLEVLDYYGNVVERPFQGIMRQKSQQVAIDIADYDFESSVYRFALTVDGQVHRGPLYPY